MQPIAGVGNSARRRAAQLMRLKSMTRHTFNIPTILPFSVVPALLAAGLMLLPIATLAEQSRTTNRILTGVVTHVTDGDTLWVKTAASSEPRKVRVIGIDAPESCQAWGAVATAALTSRVKFKTVQLSTRAKDDYGRVLAVVTLDGSDVGQWMVTSGHAWSYHRTRGRVNASGQASQSTYLGPYGAEETQARNARRGLWAVGAGSAVEPRIFRKQNGECPQRPRRR